MLDVNALWARSQELLPGLRCQDCGGVGEYPERVGFGRLAGRHYACPQAAHSPDLALLLKAMREAGWDYHLLGHYDTGAECYFWNDLAWPDMVTGPDELTAALQAAVAALEAEKEGEP